MFEPSSTKVRCVPHPLRYIRNWDCRGARDPWNIVVWLHISCTIVRSSRLWNQVKRCVLKLKSKTPMWEHSITDLPVVFDDTYQMSASDTSRMTYELGPDEIGGVENAARIVPDLNVIARQTRFSTKFGRGRTSNTLHGGITSSPMPTPWEQELKYGRNSLIGTGKIAASDPLEAKVLGSVHNKGNADSHRS